MSSNVQKFVALVDALSNCRSGASPSELAEKAGVSRPTASRLLRAFVREGLAVQDPVTKSFRPGLRLLELGIRAANRSSPIGAARLEIAHAVSEARRRVDLVVLEANEAVLIERAEWLRGQVISRPLPFRLPWHLSAAGKAIAAFSHPAILKALGLGATPKTRARLDAAALRDELETIRAKGYAEVRGEFTPDLFGVAVPIFDSSEFAVAAIAMPLRPSEIESEGIIPFLEALKGAAGRVSESLGSHRVSQRTHDF